MQNQDYDFTAFVFPQFDLDGFRPEDDDGKNRTKFEKYARFSHAKFLAKARFHFLHFAEGGDFNDAIFYEDVQFGNVEFGSKNLETGEFDGPVQFHKTRFEGDCIFAAVFHDKVEFVDVTFPADKQVLFSWYRGRTMFQKVGIFISTVFSSKTKFNHLDLSKVSFMASDVSNVEFTECVFREVDRRVKLFDEEGVETYYGRTKNEQHFGDLETLYRQFKVSFQNKRDWRRAGEFFIGEMEMRSERLKLESNSSRIELCLLDIFKQLSFYGERPERALRVFLLLLIFGIALIYLIELCSGKGFAEAILPSLVLGLNAVTFRQAANLDSQLAELVITCLRIGSAIVLPLFVLALRNRFRH